jgi:hypothetical protein
MPSQTIVATAPPEAGPVVAQALIRAADRLRITAKTLSIILGVSEATVSRMRSGGYRIDKDQKAYELAIQVIRMFRSLDGIVGGNDRVAAEWLTNFNTVLDAKPIEKIQTITGLMDVIAYLDSRRARV